METKRKKYDLTFKLTEICRKKFGRRHFSVHPNRVREWRKNKAGLQRLSEEDDKRARLRGGGRKKASEKLEVSMCEWIHSMRAKHLRVSRKMIRAKAKEVYATVSDGRDEESFTASAGWLDKFLKRNDFSVRRRTTVVAQKDAKHFTEKLVNFVTYTTRIIKAKKIQPKNIIAMDETAVWFDMVGSTTVDARGARSVPLKTTGHEKSHLTVVLAAKADGTKLKPYIVFKRGIKEVKSMQNISGVVVATSKNGWMNKELTADCLQRVVGKLNFAPRLLAWDIAVISARRPKLSSKGCDTRLHESYDNWMAGDVDKEYTAGGNMRAPNRRLLVSWVLQAWEKLDTERLKNSFKVCGLTVASDGSEDHLIHCFKEREPCASGRELLVQARQAELAEAGEGEVEESDEEEFANELVIEDRRDDDSDE
ncbi:zinc finger protein 540-like [Tachysurus ichikawai]